MNHMKKIFKTLFILFIFNIANLSASDLQSAKSDGLVGEQSDGYLGLVVASAPADVKAMLLDVNQKRKERYLEIAQKQKVSLSEIEKVAAEKAFEKTLSGNFVQINGKWVKKD